MTERKVVTASVVELFLIFCSSRRAEMVRCGQGSPLSECGSFWP